MEKRDVDTGGDNCVHNEGKSGRRQSERQTADGEMRDRQKSRLPAERDSEGEQSARCGSRKVVHL